MGWITRAWGAAKAAYEAHGFFSSELFRQTILPVAAPAVTALLGLVDGIPLAYVAAAACVAFAAVTTGLLRYDEYQERTNPSGRFRVETPFYAPELDEASEPALLKTIQLGLVCKNTASFPLHYQVEDFDAQVMGRVTTEERRVFPPAEVQPNATAVYRDYIIEVQAPLKRPIETGKLKFKIAYWKEPSRRFYIERSVRFQLRHGEEAGQFRFDWNYD